MTTKPSAAPWADEPLQLVPTPYTYKDAKSHPAVDCASEMASSHNCFIRCLNAILQQGPHIADRSSPAYNEKDVKDLLVYISIWAMTMNHHHHTEEACFFPRLEELAKQPGLMSGAKHQHEEFYAGIKGLQDYADAKQKTPESYKWSDVEDMIHSFAPSLQKHLADEVDELLALDQYDGDELAKVWAEAGKVARAGGTIGMLYDVIPLMLGGADRTYEGSNSWPILPSVMPYAVNLWFRRTHNGAWRFNPCDFWGKPRPLQMLPQEQT